MIFGALSTGAVSLGTAPPGWGWGRVGWGRGQMEDRCLGGCRYLWLLSRISSQQGQEVMNCRE